MIPDIEMNKRVAALLRDKGAILPAVISRHKQALIVACMAALVLAGLILYIVHENNKVSRAQNRIISKQDQVITAEKERADSAAKELKDVKIQDAAERANLTQQVTDLKTRIEDVKKTQSTELSQRTTIDSLRVQQINSIAIQIANLPTNANSDQISALRDQIARLQKSSPVVTPIDPPPTIHCQRLLLLPGC